MHTLKNHLLDTLKATISSSLEHNYSISDGVALSHVMKANVSGIKGSITTLTTFLFNVMRSNKYAIIASFILS